MIAKPITALARSDVNERSFWPRSSPWRARSIWKWSPKAIETARRLELLKVLGAQHGQGHLFSKPVVVEAIGEFASGARRAPAGLASLPGSRPTVS